MHAGSTIGIISNAPFRFLSAFFQKLQLLTEVKEE